MLSPREVDDFIAELGARFGPDTDPTASGTARRQELRGALELLTEGARSGARFKVLKACDRLEQIGRSRNASDQRWMSLKLNALRFGLERELLIEPRASVQYGDERKCDVLVVAAMYDPELHEFVRQLDGVREEIGGSVPFLEGRTYYRGTLLRPGEPDRSLEVVAVFQDRMGMAECGIVTANALAIWRPRFAALVGVCAGRGEVGVALNDIVVPSEVFTYDTGKLTTTGFLHEPFWVELSATVVQRVRVKATSILAAMADDIRKAFPGELVMPRVHTDVMACGSSVLDVPGGIEEIAETHRKLVGIDMESYAFVRATHLDRTVKSIVVKGVMDLSQGKTDRVKAQAAAWAAAFLARFIQSDFEALCPVATSASS